MKLIIDIDKEKYNQIIYSYQGSNVRPKDYEIAIINGTPIPNNATCGDVIRVMFPYIKVKEHKESNTVIWTLDGLNHHQFELDWWNARYRKEDKNE